MAQNMSEKTAITGAVAFPSGIAIAPVIVWLLGMVGISTPSEVAAALGGLIAALGSFIVAYLLPAKSGKYVVTEPIGDQDPQDSLVGIDYEDPEPDEVADPTDDSYVDYEVR